MKKLMLIIFLTILFLSCKNTFQLEFTNGSSNPYDLYINDAYQQSVDGKSKVTYTMPSGYWSATVIQKSGYFLIPTQKTYSGTGIAGENYYVVFP